MKKSVWYVLAIVSMLIFSSCAHVECGKIEKVKNVKTEEAASSINPSEIKGDDPNKLVLEEGEEPLLFKEYFPKKYSLKENEMTEATILPGDFAEFSFSSSQERGWRIYVRNGDNVIREEGFIVDYFLSLAAQPNVFVVIGSQKVKKENKFYYQSRKEEILKIVVINHSDHLMLPVSIFPGQYNDSGKQSIELPGR